MTKLKQFQEDTHYRALALLERSPDLSQRELARELGISLGGVNYALRALIERGMLKAQNFSSSDKKLAYAYILTPKGLAEKSLLTARFLRRKIDEYEALKAEIESLQHALYDQRQSSMFESGH